MKYIYEKLKNEIKNNNKLLKKIICLSIIMIFFIILCLIFLLKRINPETTNIFPPCLVYKLTGFKCAGCGMTRAVHNILNLNFKKAFCYNPLIFIYFIFAIYMLIRYAILKIKCNSKIKKDNINLEKIKEKFKKEGNILLYLTLIITVIFMILRNIIK